jgi:hypothetical protein
MVSSIAIPSIIGVIIAVVTPKGMSNNDMSIANIDNGKTLGINTKQVVLKFLIKTHKHKNATKKAATKDLN